MQFFYSFDNAGWYSLHYNAVIPGDAVKVDDQQRALLLQGVAAGKVIRKGPDGVPVLAEAPGPTDDQRATAERSWRDSRLEATDALVTRHRDEVDMGVATTLTAERYAELLAYRNDLRTWPEGEQFPVKNLRPQGPDWLGV